MVNMEYCKFMIHFPSIKVYKKPSIIVIKRFENVLKAV